MYLDLEYFNYRLILLPTPNKTSVSSTVKWDNNAQI